MGWTTNLRILAFCRRAVVALESISNSLRTLAHLREDEWAEAHAPRPKSDKPVTFASFDPAAASARWEEEQRILRSQG